MVTEIKILIPHKYSLRIIDLTELHGYTGGRVTRHSFVEGLLSDLNSAVLVAWDNPAKPFKPSKFITPNHFDITNTMLTEAMLSKLDEEGVHLEVRKGHVKIAKITNLEWKVIQVTDPTGSTFIIFK